MKNQYEIIRNKLCHIIEKDFCPDPCKRKDITCENCQVERLFRAINQHYIPKSDALKLAQETGKLIAIGKEGNQKVIIGKYNFTLKESREQGWGD